LGYDNSDTDSIASSVSDINAVSEDGNTCDEESEEKH
jgi:hypothetical protein